MLTKEFHKGWAGLLTHLNRNKLPPTTSNFPPILAKLSGCCRNTLNQNVHIAFIHDCHCAGATQKDMGAVSIGAFLWATALSLCVEDVNGPTALCLRIRAVPRGHPYNEGELPWDGCWNEGLSTPHLKEHGRWDCSVTRLCQTSQEPLQPLQNSLPFISMPRFIFSLHLASILLLPLPPLLLLCPSPCLH